MPATGFLLHIGLGSNGLLLHMGLASNDLLLHMGLATDLFLHMGLVTGLLLHMDPATVLLLHMGLATGLLLLMGLYPLSGLLSHMSLDLALFTHGPLPDSYSCCRQVGAAEPVTHSAPFSIFGITTIVGFSRCGSCVIFCSETSCLCIYILRSCFFFFSFPSNLFRPSAL